MGTMVAPVQDSVQHARSNDLLYTLTVDFECFASPRPDRLTVRAFDLSPPPLLHDLFHSSALLLN